MSELKYSVCAFEHLREDEALRVFFSDDFDSEVNSLSQLSIGEQTSKITKAIDILNNEIRVVVNDGFEELIAEGTKIELLDEHLKRVQLRVNNLLSTLDRLRTRLTEPYNRIAHRIFLLNRLQTTCDLLRKIIRVVHLSKRLEQCDIDKKEFVISSREIAKVAQYISELNSLISSDENLQKVETIQADIKYAKSLQERILNHSHEMLVSSLQKQDQNLIAVSLQVFHSFDLLNEKVIFVLSDKYNLLSLRIKETFDVQQLTQSKSTGPGGVSISITVAQINQFKNKLWSGIESLMELFYTSFSHLNSLFKALKKKKDSTNRHTFLELICKVDDLKVFLEKITSVLSEHMVKAAAECVPMKEALEMEYPKLLKLFSDTWKRVEAIDKEMNVECLFRDALQRFESAYLSRSLSLLHDAVNVMFLDSSDTNSVLSFSSSPSPQDIESLVKSISKELSVAAIDDQLSKSVARNVTKTVQILAGKCEHIVCNDADSTQVINLPTIGQKLNATIVTRLETFKSQMKTVLDSINEIIANSIKDSLHHLDFLIKNIVEPLMNSVQDSIEDIIFTMHQENFSNEAISNQNQSSLYMKELQSFISRVSRDYFQLYSDSTVVQKCILQVAIRTTDVFLRHVTLIRPIGNGGKTRLATDFSQLEEALSVIVPEVEGSTKCFRVLRAFKPLIFQDAETIAKSPVVGTTIPLSTVLQFMISNFAPPELKSVHDNKGWSLSRYTKWLDANENEMERLLAIQETLESYEKDILQQQGTSFAPVYPIILKLLQQTFNANK